MRDIDHDPPLIHLCHRLATEVTQTAVEVVVVVLARIRVSKLAVAVVGKRHIATAVIVEVLNIAHIQANGVGILDAYHSHLFAFGGQASYVVRRVRDAYFIRCDDLGKPVDRIELINRIGIGRRVAFLVERGLAGIDNKPGYIQAAGCHLHQVDLRVEVHGVVHGLGEVAGVDVGMGIDSNHAIMNTPRTLD